MRHRGLVAVLLLLLASVPLNAQTWQLYDNFKTDQISPNLWAITPGTICESTLECERQIRNNQLQLRIRSFGLNISNPLDPRLGQSNWSQMNLNVANPTGIFGIGANMVVTRATSSAIPGYQFGQFVLRATFFSSVDNPQSYPENKDIEANISLGWGGYNNPLEVSAHVNKMGSDFQDLGSASLGTVDVGETIRVWLLWDNAGHKFTYGVQHFHPNYTITRDIPYDPNIAHFPALYEYRMLNLQASPPNLQGSQTYSDGAVKISQVSVYR